MNNEQTMSNEEAIRILEVDKAYLYPDECYNTKAYDLAIEALRKMDLIKFNVYALNELLREVDNDNI